MTIDIVLFIFLVVCSFTDLKYRKVYNAAVAAAVILGFGLNFFYGGARGLESALFGLFTGFLLLILFYAMGGIGAGDVKFMAAVGCLKGANFVLFGGFYGAIIGGIAAAAVMLYEKRLVSAVKNILNSLIMHVTPKSPAGIKLDAGQAKYLPYVLFLSGGMLIRWAEGYFFSGVIR